MQRLNAIRPHDMRCSASQDAPTHASAVRGACGGPGARGARCQTDRQYIADALKLVLCSR